MAAGTRSSFTQDDGTYSGGDERRCVTTASPTGGTWDAQQNVWNLAYEMEFIHVMTWQQLEAPLSLSEAVQVIQDYLDTGVTIVSHKETQVQTFLALLKTLSTRKKVFDVALAATLKDHRITGLYTVNTTDFQEFPFLDVRNPHQPDFNPRAIMKCSNEVRLSPCRQVGCLRNEVKRLLYPGKK